MAIRLAARSDNADIVYRVMRAEQHPAALVEGIWAKNPLANYLPQTHVAKGNILETNWISTTRDLEWAKNFQSDNPIYVIDLKKTFTQIVDTNVQGAMTGWHFIPRDLAKRASEVLVEKWIPPEAIISVILKK
ncbi:MAG: hypothetical protein ROW48_13735 [Bellilinea sp.]